MNGVIQPDSLRYQVGAVELRSHLTLVCGHKKAFRWLKSKGFLK